MTAIIILNVVLAVAVITGIVGMLARSIFAQGLDAGPRRPHGERARRHSTSKVRILGRTVETRA
jgi:hypothetical protein